MRRFGTPAGCALALAFALGLLPAAVCAQQEPGTGPSAGTSSTPASEGWDWTVAPYLWATSVSSSLREDAPPGAGEVDFSDIISKIDMAAQVHVEGQGDRFGAFGDLTYLSLSDSAEHPLASTESSLDVSITELAGVWNIEPERYQGWDLFAGVRHFVNNADVKIDPISPFLANREAKLDQSFTDLMIGARYSAQMSDRWGATLRLDVAGGDTKGTVNASALLRYRVKHGSWVFGYRYMNVSLEAKGEKLDLTMKGPIFAFAFGL